jgi:uncharacterized protein (DUF2267 family)
VELTEQERARLAAAPADLPHEVKDVWVVSWDRHEGNLDRFSEFLAGLVLHIIRVRPETAGMFEDAPDALRVLQVLAGEGDTGLPGPGQPG